MIKAIEDIILIGAVFIVIGIVGFGLAVGSAAIEILKESKDENEGKRIH